LGSALQISFSFLDGLVPYDPGTAGFNKGLKRNIYASLFHYYYDLGKYQYGRVRKIQIFASRGATGGSFSIVFRSMSWYLQAFPAGDPRTVGIKKITAITGPAVPNGNTSSRIGCS
jgi:hypothetical protein